MKLLKEDKLLKEGWRGCNKIDIVDHGSYSDPELVYRKGNKIYRANYWAVEDSMWDYYCEQFEYAQTHNDDEAKRLNARYTWETIDDRDIDDDFNKFVRDNEQSAISDIMDMNEDD